MYSPLTGPLNDSNIQPEGQIRFRKILTSEGASFVLSNEMVNALNNELVQKGFNVI
jgi:hypothetical protein